ncbi:type II toxin-antitoxin system RelE/ParE family toxin [Pseudomonas yamanorum]|uniref:Type II toxin-antitoxin system RelE/ParE family toxin n=1 Tax=Pseudomonas yamanorum TaxID=515393 RepID=A0A7Y8FBL8_9PSED|nr:type II toxin-antitoxin system RelE/ParE family toxin [Pseudomonas yamanorum]
MSYTVAFSPRAVAQLDELEDYISQTGSPAVAARYVDAIITYCENLSLFPLRGISRDDLLPTLRTTHYRHATIIAFTVDAMTETVSVLGVFYGGQDYAALLQGEGSD